MKRNLNTLSANMCLLIVVFFEMGIVRTESGLFVLFLDVPQLLLTSQMLRVSTETDQSQEKDKRTRRMRRRSLRQTFLLVKMRRQLREPDLRQKLPNL